MVTVRVLPMGDRALLLEVPALEDVLALHPALERSRPTGVVDIVPAARTVLVRVDPRVLSLAAARAWVQSVSADPAPHAPEAGDEVVLDIVYDGPDLAGTAALLGVSPEALVAQHAAARWSVAFTGFAPGFGYLTSPDWPYDVPRLEVPRTRVPAGVGRPRSRLHRRVSARDPGRLAADRHDAGATVRSGCRVPGAPRTRSARPLPSVGAGPRRDHRLCARPPSPVRRIAWIRAKWVESGPMGSRPAVARDRRRARRRRGRRRRIRIVEPGLLATLQDLGRPGAASVGVSTSGALDRGALRTANRLVGNTEGAAAIEVTMGGFRATADADLWFAVTGAWGILRLGGAAIDPYEAHRWPAGAELHLDWFGHGARAYLAVRGGLDGPVTLGSRATDILAGLGPRPLRAGDVVPVGGSEVVPIPAAVVAPWGAPHDDELEVELAPGPRGDWFAASAHRTLFETVWTVSNRADRIGLRLDGPPLARERDGELPSEGMVPGAMQVSPSGQPTILLADGPVTGGYPVIAVVTDAGLDLLAQARPGTRVRFRHARPF